MRLVRPAFCIATLVLLASACADKPKRVAIMAPPPETVYVRTPVPAARPPLPVSPLRLAFDALGDTARLAIPAGAQCEAATEAVAHIDSIGVVTSVGNGDTHVRCWQDGQTATIKIHVQQALSHVLIVSDRAMELGRAGDSLHLSLNQTDRRGVPVTGGAPRWSSLTPAIVTVDPSSGVALGVADSGTGRIIGQVEGVADTVFVQVGAKGSAAKLLSRNTNTTSRARTLAAAVRTAAQRNAETGGQASAPGSVINESFAPTSPLQGQAPAMNAIGARAPRIADSLFRDPSSLIGGQRWIVPNGFGAFAERRVIPSSSGTLAKHSGALFGGGIDVTTRGILSFSLRFATGSLTGDTTTSAADRTLTVSEGSFDACLAIAPWLTIVGGAESRVYQSTSMERWVSFRAGGQATFNLGGGPLYGYAQGLVMPLISVQNDVSTLTAPSFGIAAGLGVGLETQRISTRVMYNIEHYTFPASSGRKEQFAELVFRFGYKFGW